MINKLKFLSLIIIISLVFTKCTKDSEDNNDIIFNTENELNEFLKINNVKVVTTKAAFSAVYVGCDEYECNFSVSGLERTIDSIRSVNSFTLEYHVKFTEDWSRWVAYNDLYIFCPFEPLRFDLTVYL
jgi:hypothetical protein